MQTLKKANIIGTGMFLPEKRLTNADLEKMVDTTDEWIITRSGIKERRIVEADQTLSDLAVPAAQMAMKNAGVTPDQIGVIILATFTPDRPISSTACIIQHKLGCKNAAAFDVEVACSGFIYASALAKNFIATGMYEYVLVIGADILSKVIDFTDRNTCVLFGDGAGAVVYGVAKDEKEGVFDVLLGADGGGADHIMIPAGGSSMPTTVKTVEDRMHYVKINGKEVFKFSTKIVGDMIEQVLNRNNMKLDDVDLIIPHQANIRIIESAAKKFGCPMEKFFINLDKYGNTVAATIPICMHEAIAQGRIKQGSTVLLAGFGGGLTWGVIALKYGKISV